MTSTPARRRTAWPLAVALLVTSGCAEESPIFGTLRYEGDNLDVWASEGMVACGGSYAYMDGWLDGWRERLGDYARPQHHVFNWLGDDDFDASPCNTPDNGCARWRDNVAYSRLMPLEHELVHTELDTHEAASLFTEGIAELFGARKDVTSLSSAFSFDELVARQRQVPGDSYETAGRFSRYLVETYGMDAYIGALNASPREGGATGISSALARHTGDTLEDIRKDFESYPVCQLAEWRYFDYECLAMPATPWVDDGRWEVELDLSCEASDVIGPRDDRIWTMRAIEIETEGRYLLSGGIAGVQTYLAPCDTTCFRDDDEATDAIDSLLPIGRVDRYAVVLEPGRYWFRFELPFGSTESVSMTVERAEP